MVRTFFCMLGLVGVLTFFSAGPRTSAGDDDALKKIERLRKELDDLREKEKARAMKEEEARIAQAKKEGEARIAHAKKEAEVREALAKLEQQHRVKLEEQKRLDEIARKNWEEADKKKHYVKVELRGKLIHAWPANPQPLPISWHLATNETRWPLSFGTKKELVEAAAKLRDKSVIVSGSISTAKSFRPAYPRLPNRWDLPNWEPYYSQQGEQWNPYLPGTELNPLVVVDSIKLSEK